MRSFVDIHEKIYATARHRISQASARKREIFDWAIGIGREVGYRRYRRQPRLPRGKMVRFRFYQGPGGPRDLRYLRQ